MDKVAACGHLMTKLKCKESTDIRTCRENCSRTLPCGHKCTDKCFNDCTKVDCKELVESQVAPLCGHPLFKIPCHLNKEGMLFNETETLEH